MGWFWANNSAGSRPGASHRQVSPDASSPPPECPMHNKITSFPPKQNAASSEDSATCPIASPQTSSDRTSTMSKLNPLNYMPNLSQERSSYQTRSLPTQRTTSSIPRGDMEKNWEYPSPQQMYNAMLRKGYDGTPEDAVESMVEVHNFLNEGAWEEIEGWEARFAGGLIKGWEACRKGEEGWEELVVNGMWKSREDAAPRLMRFMGRPGDMSPKARMFDVLGRMYPARFGSEPPFDRHDWFVQRTLPNGQTTEVRYVIDYYSGPPEPTGEPVFFLDVRPAIDGPTAACERMLRWGGDVWHRASGADARQKSSPSLTD